MWLLRYFISDRTGQTEGEETEGKKPTEKREREQKRIGTVRETEKGRSVVYIDILIRRILACRYRR